MNAPLLSSESETQSDVWPTYTRPTPKPARSAGLWGWLVAGLGIFAGAGLTYALLQPVPEPKPPAPEVKRAEFIQGVKNIFLETQGDIRRVIVMTQVVHREGQLEGLLTKARTKEHEYILAFDGDAVHIHTALLAAKAEAGAPVKFEPKYTPASGSVILVSVRYEKGGKVVTHPAQDWIQNVNTKKSLADDWVFGGSKFVEDFDNPLKKVYLANYGDIICVCNIDSALMDLPFRSNKRLEERVFHAFTEKIPAEGTRVELILEPAPKK